MVKKTFIFFAYVMFFISALIYFTPKISIYNYIEKELLNYDVIISNETVLDSGFSLNLTDADIFVKSIHSATVQEVDIKIFALYNNITLHNITLSNVAASFVPLNIENVTIRHSVIDPLRINAYSVGEFGEVEASLNILDRNVSVRLTPSALMLKDYRNSMKQLSKNEDGSYSYVKTF